MSVAYQGANCINVDVGAIDESQIEVIVIAPGSDNAVAIAVGFEHGVNIQGDNFPRSLLADPLNLS